jgi:hypothetical protein
MLVLLAQYGRPTATAGADSNLRLEKNKPACAGSVLNYRPAAEIFQMPVLSNIRVQSSSENVSSLANGIQVRLVLGAGG